MSSAPPRARTVPWLPSGDATRHAPCGKGHGSRRQAQLHAPPDGTPGRCAQPAAATLRGLPPAGRTVRGAGFLLARGVFSSEGSIPAGRDEIPPTPPVLHFPPGARRSRGTDVTRVSVIKCIPAGTPVSWPTLKAVTSPSRSGERHTLLSPRSRTLAVANKGGDRVNGGTHLLADTVSLGFFL